MLSSPTFSGICECHARQRSFYAIEIDEYERGNNTGKLIIELPDDAAARKRVFAWAGKIAREQGFDPEREAGQRYVFVMLD